ncbi:MAG: ATP-binding protein, partial [Actinomycetota bacterium]|nr:ATP-binding protein [Actinomycetota bacterium]
MLLGRNAEQRAIEQLVAAARIGRGGLLVVTGEPGVGKTALLEAALRRAIGFRVLRATGTQAE